MKHGSLPRSLARSLPAEQVEPTHSPDGLTEADIDALITETVSTSARNRLTTTSRSPRSSRCTRRGSFAPHHWTTKPPDFALDRRPAGKHVRRSRSPYSRNDSRRPTS